MKAKKTKKERSDQYEDKLYIDGTLDQVLKLTVPEPKEKEETKNT